MSDVNNLKHVIDVGAAVSAVGSVMHWMPEVAALLSVIWYLIRFYELWKNRKPKC